MIFEMFLSERAWLIPHLMAKSSASVVVTKDAWWTVLTRGQLAKWIYATEVAISLLMLASIITSAVWGLEECWMTISSSSWPHVFFWFFSFLLTKLKENWLEKLSIIRWPGENSGSRGEKEGNIPWDLILESIRWPLVRDFCQLVKEPMLWELCALDFGGSSFNSFLRMWFSGTLKEQIRDLLAIFWRWNLIGMRPASASMPSRGDILNALNIQMAALLCILLRIFIWYDTGALL